MFQGNHLIFRHHLARVRLVSPRLKDKEELEGVDLAIAFVPGVPFIADKFGYLGPVKKMTPASAPATSANSSRSFNTATAMKELKAMEAGEINPFKPAPGTEAKPVQQKGPMKLPSDRSIESPKATEDSKYHNTSRPTTKPADKPAMKSNAFRTASAQGQAKTAMGGVAGATATARTINNKPASPFKPTNASGIQTNVNSVAQNNAMKNAMRTDNRLETKPSAQKPINSAFKPAGTTATA